MLDFCGSRTSPSERNKLCKHVTTGETVFELVEGYFKHVEHG